MGSGMLLGQETKAINRVDSQTLQSAYKNGLISNAKEINTGSYKGELNRPRLVDTTSTNIPSDLSWGVREVFFFSNSKIVIQITGVDTNNKSKVWYCVGSSDGSTFTIGKWDTMSGGNSITTPGTAEALGLTKLYDSVGNNDDGTMTQSAIKTALDDKAEADHTHTKEEVGLGNVGNFKAVSTVADQALTDSEKANARTNIGAGTSSFSGSYNDLTNKPTIPSVGNGTVTIKQAGTSKGTFTMNQTGDTVIELTDTNTNTWSELKGATTDAAGTAGYAPAPEAGSANRYLRSDGTWAVPPDTNTTYSTGTASTTGLTKLYTATGANTDGAMTQNAVTSALSGKAESSHTHTKSDITDFPTSMPASDVSDWAKADTKPTYTKAEVGLSNVGNFKAVSTVAEQGLTDTEKVNARTNIGAGTSSFSGSYNDLSNKPTIPTVGNGTVTINQNGTSKGTFTMNQGGNTTINLTDTNTDTWTPLKGATTDTAGTAGYAPAPAQGAANRYLRSDGTWAVPPDTNTTYGTANASTTGLTKLYTATGTATDGTMTQSAIKTALDTKAASSHTHSSADINSLDASKLTGTIDIARLPQGALDRIVRVDDDTARFKLTTSNVQLGDTVKVTSTGKMYYVVDESKLSEAGGYEVYTAESATSVPWSGVTGKPSSYTPSSHTHTKSEVGLGNVDNTADANKSVKYATSAGTATNATKVNNHTVNADVPSGAKFTDTNTWRPVETTLSTENLNNITTPGFYNAGGGNSVTNKPSGVEHFGLIVVHRASGSYYAQIIFSDNKSWRRYCVNSTWGSWIEEKITDTTYGTGTASASGLTKLYTSTGTATDGTMTRTAITNALGSYVAKSNVKDYMALFQDTQPSSSSNANFWVNTTESAASIAQYSIPQINDTATNAVDTWSSNKLNSEFGKTGSCMVFGGTDTTDMSITDTTQHYIPITRTLSNQRDADDYMSCTSDGAILLKPGVYIVSGKIQIASTSAAVTLFSTWNASTDNKTYSVTYETQVSENSTYVANTSNPLNAKLSLNTMTINVTSNTYLKASIQAVNSVTLKVAQQACRFQVTKIK